jgi:hypothetical protein
MLSAAASPPQPIAMNSAGALDHPKLSTHAPNTGAPRTWPKWLARTTSPARGYKHDRLRREPGRGCLDQSRQNPGQSETGGRERGYAGNMRAISIIGLGMLVGACASSEVQQIPPPRPIICTVGADCDAKWSRAVAWIKTNSTLKVQAQTDTVVQTAGPVGLEPTPAFTVTKVARGDGRYEITFNGGCGSPSSCVPTIPESRARFTAFVLGEAPPPQVSSQ